MSQLEPVSNIKTWIEAGVQIERVAQNRDGFLGIKSLYKIHEFFKS